MESREQGPESGDLNPEQTLVITSQVSCVCPLRQYVICVSCITSDISDMDQLMSDLMPTLRMSEPLQATVTYQLSEGTDVCAWRLSGTYHRHGCHSNTTMSLMSDT